MVFRLRKYRPACLGGFGFVHVINQGLKSRVIMHASFPSPGAAPLSMNVFVLDLLLGSKLSLLPSNFVLDHQTTAISFSELLLLTVWIL